MKKNAIIFGAYGEENLGDDLLLQIIVDWISENSGYEISIACIKTEYLKKIYKGKSFLTKAEANYMSPDLYILGGGTQFFSFKPTQKNNEINLLGRIFSKINVILKNPRIIYLIFFKYFSIKNVKTKKIALGLGLGPFEIPGSDVVVKSKLHDFSVVFSRDKCTHEICKKNGVYSVLFSDLCFSKYFYEKYNFKHLVFNGGKASVGIVLRDWAHSENGENLNKKIILWANENKNKYNIKFFVFSNYSDKKLIVSLTQLRDFSIEIWMPECLSPEEYLKKISDMDVILTSRYHAAVFAANFGVPAIALGLDPKLFHLCEDVDGFIYFGHEEGANCLDEAVNEILGDYSGFQRKIYASVARLRKKSDELFVNASTYL